MSKRIAHKYVQNFPIEYSKFGPKNVRIPYKQFSIKMLKFHIEMSKNIQNYPWKCPKLTFKMSKIPPKNVQIAHRNVQITFKNVQNYPIEYPNVGPKNVKIPYKHAQNSP